MRRSYVVPMRWMVIYEYEVPGGVLNLNSANYPDHGHNGDLPLQQKIPMAEPGIEPRTSETLILDDEAGHQCTNVRMQICPYLTFVHWLKHFYNTVYPL